MPSHTTIAAQKPRQIGRSAPLLSTPTYLRSAFRLARFGTCTADWVVRLIATGILRRDDRDRSRYVAGWACQLLSRTGVAVHVHGAPPVEPALLVGNHRSYMDVAVIAASRPCVFVAKAEIRRWPLLGYGAAVAGCLFVDRSSPRSRARTRVALRERIEAGQTVAIFPEGTTYAGPGHLTLRPGSFVEAARADVPVVPVAIVYTDRAMAYVPGDSFVRHFLTRMRRRRVDVHVSFGPMLRGNDAADLRERAGGWLTAEVARLEQVTRTCG